MSFPDHCLLVPLYVVRYTIVAIQVSLFQYVNDGLRHIYVYEGIAFNFDSHA